MIFIGIDLAWTYKNETGLCIIDDSGYVYQHGAAVFSDVFLKDVILAHSKDQRVCVGIDAPLVVTKIHGSRPAEGLMMRDPIHGHHLRAFNTNRSYLNKVFKVIRGEEIVSLVQADHPKAKIGNVFMDGPIVMMETFPTGISLGLFPELYPLKYKLKSKVAFQETKDHMVRLLKHLRALETTQGPGRVKGIETMVSQWQSTLEGISRKDYKKLEDEVDAFLCAYGMFKVWHGQAEQRLYGDTRDGFIMVPVALEMT